MIKITKVAKTTFYTITLVDFKSRYGAMAQHHYEIIDNEDGKCYGICYTDKEIQPTLKLLMRAKRSLVGNVGT